MAKHDNNFLKNCIFYVGGSCMEFIQSIDKWKNELEPVLESKVAELHLMGYDEATNEGVWNCLTEKVWKDSNEKRLYEMVQDIFHLKPGIYMSYLTLNAIMDDTDLESSINALIGNN